MLKISQLENSDILNEDNCYGRFYLEEDLNEMARFGKVPNSQYEIHLQGGEGYIPHIHICINEGKNIVLRLCLLTNEYFREKDDKMNILNSKERKALNNYLSAVSNRDFGFALTKWHLLCFQWNEMNPSHKIENINLLKRPDYSTINEPKNK